ncbi:MAG: DUF1553 domain-containing protein [Planctomycetales bacterium]|nr:DUF1553 domain-containing protein [Planctomycetales bacterium]
MKSSAARTAAFCMILGQVTAILAAPTETNDGVPNRSAYESVVQSDHPVGWWRMRPSDDGKRVGNDASKSDQESLVATLVGSVALKQPGPQSDDYPLFEKVNPAIGFRGIKGYLKVKDPGAKSALDFTNGDAITLEAWVLPLGIKDGQQVYVVGKGRTGNEGFGKDNQNYALRLRGERGSARLSFLFHSTGSEAKPGGEYHRWNSRSGIEPDSGWHHIAITYVFGKPESIAGYLDGKSLEGDWDYGGPTTAPPIVDDDELWIGSSQGGSADSTFVGLIDEVAVYREALSAERLSKRFVFSGRPSEPETIDLAALPEDSIRAQIFEGLLERSWKTRGEEPTTTYRLPAMASVTLPHKYTSRGVIGDRSNPCLLQLDTKRELPAGRYRLLIRSLNAARLIVDGKLAAQTDYLQRNASGHEHVRDLTQSIDPQMRPLPQGHQEQVVELTLTAGMHHFRLQAVVGGAGLRLEPGEPSVAIAAEGEPFVLLTANRGPRVLASTQEYEPYAAKVHAEIEAVERESRRTASADELKYWQKRHQQARDYAASQSEVQIPTPVKDFAALNAVDHFINERLAKEGIKQTPLVDDLAFLRRLTLVCRGNIPTRQEIAAFLKNDAAIRRSRAIERLLVDPGWADQNVSYWQDVLAENPGIVKPTLNNTGPFRTWIYESLLDNKPIDQFATELVMMEGSVYYGGPAGFGMATENDVPLAEKASILAKAFLGQEMKCARCHDAPQHPFAQHDLFGLAAMLYRQPIVLPKTSTVPPRIDGRQPLVHSALKPGEKIAAGWPFPDLVGSEPPPEIIRNPQDSREKLAALITLPQNGRFAKVAVNRLWKRLMGWGLVEPVDDWNNAQPSHPELLEWLARQLVIHDYDLKHVAGLILGSHAYQRAAVDEGVAAPLPANRLFAGPARKRMSAEQIVDSLFAAADKPLGAEMLTLDPEGRLPAETFLNLGTAKRAWQFTSISTDRDRPALTLPRTQAFLDLLTSFGWRDYRPSPLTERDEAAGPLQPLALANGIIATSVCRLSEDSSFTSLCLEDRSVEELVDQVYLQLLSRSPMNDERVRFVELLGPGYDQRKTGEKATPRILARRPTVSWSNHLSPEATTLKLQLEKEVIAGDPPTVRLTTDWRERLEDMLYVLINSPEFVWIP